MGFKFRKIFKIIPGVKINASKSGLSLSLGGKGASVNLSGRGVKGTVGLPGTGLSYSAQTKKKKRNQVPLRGLKPGITSLDPLFVQQISPGKPPITSQPHNLNKQISFPAQAHLGSNSDWTPQKRNDTIIQTLLGCMILSVIVLSPIISSRNRALLPEPTKTVNGVRDTQFDAPMPVPYVAPTPWTTPYSDTHVQSTQNYQYTQSYSENRQRTQSVSGYTRKDGTYVHSYKRRHR